VTWYLVKCTRSHQLAKLMAISEPIGRNLKVIANKLMELHLTFSIAY